MSWRKSLKRAWACARQRLLSCSLRSDLVDERLALNTDKLNKWQKHHEGQIARDLRPRARETGKSMWAHYATEDQPLAELIEKARPRPNLELQALMMYLARCRANPRSPRRHVGAVSIPRSAFASGTVVTTPQEHMIAGLDGTHRELRVRGEEGLNDAVARVRENESLVTERYSFDMLLPMIRDLVEMGIMRESYREAAEALIASRD